MRMVKLRRRKELLKMKVWMARASTGVEVNLLQTFGMFQEHSENYPILYVLDTLK